MLEWTNLGKLNLVQNSFCQLFFYNTFLSEYQQTHILNYFQRFRNQVMNLAKICTP